MIGKKNLLSLSFFDWFKKMAASFFLDSDFFKVPVKSHCVLKSDFFHTNASYSPEKEDLV